MGVMACDRRGCENVMCGRMIDTKSQYYICDDCWSELLEFKHDWPEEMSRADMFSRIDSFMNSVPGTSILLEGEQIDEEFHRICHLL